MTTGAKYVQGFSVDDGEIVLVDRSKGYDEKPRLERSLVNWACFVRSPLPREILRELKSASSVKSVSLAKGYFRIGWTDRVACRAGCDYLEMKGIRTFEGNVNPLRRLLVERKIVPARPRSTYMDIETDPRPGLANKLQMRILIVGFEDFDTREQTSFVLEEDSDEGERKLLEKAWKFLEAYDQVISWNGDRFDEPVFKARTKKQKIPVEPRRLLWLDHMRVYQKQNAMAASSGEEKQSYALANVCAALGLEGKDDFDVRTVYDEWAAGGERQARAVRYCMKDVSRMPEIEKKTGYLELFRTLCESTGVFAHSGSIGPSHQVESFLLRLGQDRGYRFPTRFVDEEEGEEGGESEEEKFRGALVINPSEAGILKNVHVVDFARLYPSVILSLNLSPETKVEQKDLLAGFPNYLRGSEAYRRAEREMKERKPPEGAARSATGSWFNQNPIGILPLAVEELLRLRKSWDEKKASCAPGTDEWKEADRRSSAYKIAANSFYGVVGSKGSMFFDLEVAESTTQTGVALIEAVNAHAPNFDLRSIYTDTDGSFLVGIETAGTTERMTAFVEDCNTRVLPKIIAGLGGRNRIKLEYEKSFKLLVFSWNEKERRPASKKYVAKYAMFKGKAAREDSKPEVKGLELKRGDSMRLTREMQKDVIALLIGKESERVEDFDDLVGSWRARILEGKLDSDDVKVSKQIQKGLEEYERKPKKHPISLGKATVLKVERKGLVVRSIFAEALGCTKKVLLAFEDIHESCEFFNATKDERSAKGLVDYTAELLVNDYAAGAAHVQIARILEATGTPVRQGDRVEYVVIDGSTSPKTIIPFEVWDGETLDRIDLWLQVWTASKRLLMGAFPGVDWSRFDADYPRKERAPRAAKQVTKVRKRKVALGQEELSLFGQGEKGE